MIVTRQKTPQEIFDSLKDFNKIFIIGCGECAATCKTGGAEEVQKIKKELEQQGKAVLGCAVPNAPCLAPQIKTEFARNMGSLREAEAILVMSCGLGVQSVKDNDRIGLTVLPGCNTIFAATMNSAGNFQEKCSMCADCYLEFTGGVCPITLCSKGLLNGPCGGMDKGKCEVDKERDCAWVLIYRELEKKKKLNKLRKIQGPRNFKKALKPHTLILDK